MTKNSNKVDLDKRLSERELLIEQLKHVAKGLGDTFSPFCEIVVHDLDDPEHAILAIHNNLSMRKLGAQATELGLARISDPDYPQVISNYANAFGDGRQVKSTSIGIKDSSGEYIAALCMNVDLTMFQNLQVMIGKFTNIDNENAIEETIELGGAEGIISRIDEFASRLSTTPRSLNRDDRKTLIKELKDAGCLEIRRAPDIIAKYIGVSRATIYGYAK